MSLMFSAREGTWNIRSEKDPRWNATGRGYGLVTSGGPNEIYEEIEKLKTKLVEPPDDLAISFWKD